MHLHGCCSLPSAGLPNHIPILFFLLALLLMQPHAETVQGADSWLHQGSDYFSARAAPRFSSPDNDMSLCNTRDRNTHLGLRGQQDHSSRDAICFKYHSTVRRERTQLRLLYEEVTLAMKINRLSLQNQLVLREK